MQRCEICVFWPNFWGGSVLKLLICGDNLLICAVKWIFFANFAVAKLYAAQKALLTTKTNSMNEIKKALFISQEITPYLAANAHSRFGRALPEAIIAKGIEVRTFMPRYGCINERRNQLHEVIRLSGLNIVIDDTNHPLLIKVATLQPSRMQVYFIDNDDYFEGHGAEELETVTNAEENDERSIFYVRGVIETARKLRWAPEVVHCTGWISAVAPLYLKHMYGEDPTFVNTKVVFSLFDCPFEGELDKRMAEKLQQDGFSAEDVKSVADGVTYESLCRLAMDHADAIVISSGNVPASLVEYARSAGKPLLEVPECDNLGDVYMDFYKSL